MKIKFDEGITEITANDLHFYDEGKKTWVVYEDVENVTECDRNGVVITTNGDAIIAVVF